MNIKSNKGMFLEEIINRTISYYSSKNIAYFEKRNIPFKILKMINEKTFVGLLFSKSTVDYTGVYKQTHYEFEAKQTEKTTFDFKNLKNHQYLFLKKMCDSFNACCFLIIYMAKFDKFYLIEFKKIVEYIQLNKTHIIHFDQIQKYGHELEIYYHGILNLVEVLEKIKL